MSGELDGLPYATAYVVELNKSIEALDVDLTTKRHIDSWEQYLAKVAERRAYVWARNKFMETVKKAGKGELDSE